MIIQIAIALTGIISIWLTQHKDENKRRYACLFGLASQPFWLYSTYVAGQWGIFCLSVVYTYIWYVGYRNHWRKG